MGIAHHLFVGGTNQCSELIGAVTWATLVSLLLPLAKTEGDIHVAAHGSGIFA